MDAPIETPPPTRRVQLLDDRLAALVTAHTLLCDGAVVHCATWRSEGFAAVGHPELTLTLRRDADDGPEALSLDALRLMMGVYDNATQGRALHAGALGEFPAGLFDTGEAHGLLAVRPERPVDAAVPPRGLRVLVVHRDEMQLAGRYGIRRVLSRLARQARIAPFPTWWDAARASVAQADDDRTLLASAPRLHVLDAAAWLGDDVVTLRLSPGARNGLREALAQMDDDTPLAMLVDAPDDADAWLVWTPGQRAPSAAARDGSRGQRVAGNFVRLARGDSYDGAFTEDGFSFALPDDAWSALRARLGDGVDFGMAPRGNAKGLRVVWAEADPLPAPREPVAYQSVEVHAGLGARPAVDVDALTDYVRSVREAVAEHLDDTWWRTGHDLLLHLELHPNRRTLANLALRPGPSHPALNGLCGRVESLQRPAITGAVVLQARFALWGGAAG